MMIPNYSELLARECLSEAKRRCVWDLDQPTTGGCIVMQHSYHEGCQLRP